MKVLTVLVVIGDIFIGLGYLVVILIVVVVTLLRETLSWVISSLILVFGSKAARKHRYEVLEARNRDERIRYRKPDPDDYFAYRRLDRDF